MKQKVINIATLGSLLISSSIAVNAKTIDSHVHGLSELTIAIDEKTLEIEMTSPAMNLVGFEHKAHTQADIDMVNKVTKQLSNHKELFSFSGGSCLLVDSSTDTSGIISSSKVEGKHHESDEHKSHHDENDHDDEHDDHKSHHDENDHDDEHDDHKSHHDENDHDDEHDDHKSHHKVSEHDHDEHSEQSNHYEIISYYRYDCKKASTLTAITVRMFDQFSGVEKITAKWLTDVKQGSVILSPTKQIIKLR